MSGDEAEEVDRSRIINTYENISNDLRAPRDVLDQNRIDAQELLAREQRLTEQARARLNTPLNPFEARAARSRGGGTPTPDLDIANIDPNPTTSQRSLPIDKNIFPLADAFIDKTDPKQFTAAETFNQDATEYLENNLPITSLWRECKNYFNDTYSGGGGKAYVYVLKDERYEFLRTGSPRGNYSFNGKEALRVYRSGVINPPKKFVNSPRATIFNPPETPILTNEEKIENLKNNLRMTTTQAGPRADSTSSLVRAKRGDENFGKVNLPLTPRENTAVTTYDAPKPRQISLDNGMVKNTDLASSTHMMMGLDPSSRIARGLAPAPPQTDNLTDIGSVNVGGLRNYYDPVGTNQRVLKQLEYRRPTRLFSSQF